MKQMRTKITTGKFGNGDTDILKGIITRSTFHSNLCKLYYSFAENKKHSSEVGYEQIYSLDRPPLRCYIVKNPGSGESGIKTFKT
jgi:hypothetical protein